MALLEKLTCNHMFFPPWEKKKKKQVGIKAHNALKSTKLIVKLQNQYFKLKPET